MDRHYDANGSASAPVAPTNILGANVYPTGGASPSQPGPWWWHMVTEELRAVIVAGGLTPDRATLTQVRDAILAMIAANAPTSIGRHTIWVPAAAIYSRITNGAGFTTLETTANKVIVSALTFDPATTQYAQFAVQMPKSWNEGTFTAVFVWSHPTGTGDVVWGIQGMARSDTDSLDATWGAAVTVTDSGGTADTVYKAAETAAITPSGAPIENDLALFQIYRDAVAGADTLGVAARLHGIALFYTTNAGTDA